MTIIQGPNDRRVFTLDEAQQLLPLIQRITVSAHKQIESLIPLLNQAPQSKRDTLDETFQSIFYAWQQKIRRLGGVTKGMWLVDFDSGQGYYCWQYPERDISHFHGYQEGFSGRTKL